jgi:ABC-2 type transport system permease protein
VPLAPAIGFSLAPLVGGLFMILLKDPERARSMGLITAKAQLTVGTADWPAYFAMLAQAAAIGGAIVFAIATAWTFGREFADHTAKEWLAVPAPRAAVIGAKFILIVVWTLLLTLLVFGLGLVVGSQVDIPGWSTALARSAFVDVAGAAGLTIALLPFVALTASAGRGDLPAFGWAILTIVSAQIAAATGWGDWFPWAVPALFSGVAGPRTELLGPHSYAVVALASLGGLAATFAWWRFADQAR